MSSRLANEKISSLIGIYEFFIGLYIILAPINNALNTKNLVPVNVFMIVCIAVLCIGFIIGFFDMGDNSNKFFSMFVLAVFFFEIILQNTTEVPIEKKYIFIILLYVIFLRVSPFVSLKTIYCYFYISAVISAGFTLYYGNYENTVSRTATLVDGSIAPIVLAIVLFADEQFEKTGFYKLLKVLAAFALCIVALYGMSRSRLLIIAVMFIIRILLHIKNLLVEKTVNVLLIPGLVLVLFIVIFLLKLPSFQNLLSLISDRFEDGFLLDNVREVEIKQGLTYFKENLIFGKGWGDYTYIIDGYTYHYYNHSMYVAILARGGLLMAIACACSFIALVRKTFESRKSFCIIIAAIFFLLAYGNAGLFNYTIITLFIPLVLNLKKLETED